MNVSPLEVPYFSRIPEARPPELATRPLVDPLWPVRGRIHPNECPAIRSANRLGIHLFTHHPLIFEGPRNFRLDVFARPDQTLLHVPGVIGSLDSTLCFAKVDVGISVVELPCPFLCTPVLNLDASYRLIVPSTLYPKGFTGPLFVPISAHAECELASGAAIAQLIALSDASDLVLRGLDGSAFLDEHGRFEGLLLPGWNNRNCPRRHMRASNLLHLMTSHTEADLWNMITHELA